MPRFSDVFVAGCRLEGSPRLGRNEAILQMLVRLAEVNELPAAAIMPAFRVILQREELGSTGIGLGVAVPHARCPYVTRQVGVVGVVHGPSVDDHEALDGEPIDLFFLLLAPIPPEGERVKAEDNVMRRLRDFTFLNRLRQTTDAESIMDVIHLADEEKPG
jgi:mannitol/fructose-specific phosphotransferase system IIA component (Ntr-type)